jgi:hypothetical protein
MNQLTNSLAVKASGVLESFLNALGAGGTSVPWLSGGSGVVSSSSVGVTSRGRSGDSSLRSRGGGSLGLSSRLGLSGCGRWLSVVCLLSQSSLSSSYLLTT